VMTLSLHAKTALLLLSLAARLNFQPGSWLAFFFVFGRLGPLSFNFQEKERKDKKIENWCAAKSIKIALLLPGQSSFWLETATLLQVFDSGGHPNISGLWVVYEDDNYDYLVLDLICGGEIFDHLVNDGVFLEDNPMRLMREASSALSFLDSIDVVHADLKPENIMVFYNVRMQHSQNC
jgi:serine/threonine protein kinase